MTPDAIAQAYRILGMKTAKQSAAFVLASLIVAERPLWAEDLCRRTGLGANTVRSVARQLVATGKAERVRIKANRYGFRARFSQTV